MRIEQRVWSKGGWTPSDELALDDAQLVLVFGGRDVLDERTWAPELRRSYPAAIVFGCSTAGEICGTRVRDDTVVATAIRFDATPLEVRHTLVDEGSDASARAGATVAQALPTAGLRHVLVLSDGQRVNGSELVRGMLSHLPPGVQVTGGLAGDGPRFERTLVLADGEPQEHVVAVLGLYGEALRIGFGSLGGWDTFGPRRMITRSRGNVLYELDGKPALELYKTYLGEHAADLPATGLLFPLSVGRPGERGTVVRTILAVDEAEQSLTFAGDVPEGSLAQLMKANFERLIDGAADAAKQAQPGLDLLGGSAPELAVLISCVGRKLVLRQRTEEEVESVREVLGSGTALTGFYSYGEICPAAPDADCELHNQTMTITTFREALAEDAMHRLLQRQLDRHTAGADRIPPEWAAFVEAVDTAYHQADTDRAMLERSLDLSSGELLQTNADLRGALAALAARSRELERSNAELQQFAYIASHDLQEPLRTVQSYLQLLQRRYGNKLDADADEFIGFAVQGAQRMRALITDLLAYARVSSRARPPGLTPLADVVSEALRALQAAIDERRAEIIVEPLPTVVADGNQLRQLYQNLVANALKFNRNVVPQVRLSAVRQAAGWRLSVADNGIGLDSAYKDKIFEVFKRLYGRDEFEGTGIGLAICKKIVERHGGQIGVESSPGEGATFWFTLPDDAGERGEA